jgi:ABC-type polysaccharide/polyol phosphate transport system ATPase subunit
MNMSDIAIQASHLYKMYLIGHVQQRQDTLRDLLIDLVKRPFQRDGKQDKVDQIWALKDVSFEVKHGEVLGIIGRNGAGKSTLLKILSRITEPTQGRAVINGRVGSLLEVGTGFHPELTGRENIYLNGSLLGMRRTEIERKFDEIVAFAEIEQFLDTPVKRYSSGMYVRLAFAVAAHLEPEILLVDEVLAVGDIEFQKKCLGKMGEVANLGRTVLLVSHNIHVVHRLCSKSILLDHGQIASSGPTDKVISDYYSKVASIAPAADWFDLTHLPREGVGKARFTRAYFTSGNPKYNYQAYPGGPFELTLEIVSEAKFTVTSISFSIFDKSGLQLVNADTKGQEVLIHLKQGSNFVKFKVDRLNLTPGVYTFGCWMANYPAEIYDWIKFGVDIEVIDPDAGNLVFRPPGVVYCDFVVEQF